MQEKKKTTVEKRHNQFVEENEDCKTQGCSKFRDNNKGAYLRRGHEADHATIKFGAGGGSGSVFDSNNDANKDNGGVTRTGHSAFSRAA